MLDKRFVERFLKLNHVAVDAPAAEIKSVLTKARWNTEEIETALMLVQGTDPNAQEKLRQRESERAFRPDIDWSSSKLSSLLGIDVVVDPRHIRMPALQEKVAHLSRKMLLGCSAIVFALVTAALLGVLLMYLLGLGPWQAPVDDII